jgi:hypothetical protein
MSGRACREYLAPALPGRAGFLAILSCCLAAGLTLTGCGIIERLTGEAARKEARAEQARQRSEALQQKVMRFADQYLEQMVRAMEPLADQAGRGEARVAILTWQLSNATAAVQIAAGPNPITNAVDMLVMVSLNRRVVESRWPDQHREAVHSALQSYRALEQDAWQLLEGVGSEEQHEELRQLLDAWFAENPGLKTAAFVRFADFADVGVKTEARASPGLLGIVGLDPLSGIDPAVREVERTRQLAERAVYYAQRLPQLLDLQVQLMAARAGATVESGKLLETADGINALSASFARLADEAPELLSREREAAIAQFMGELGAQQQDMLVLTSQIQAALDAGAVTAEALDRLVASADRMLARFERAPGTGPEDGTRPFDITEYTRSIVELSATARELQALVESLDRAAPALAGQVGELTVRVQGAVDHAFHRALLLILALLLAGIAYRLAAARIDRSSRTSASGQ